MAKKRPTHARNSIGTPRLQTTHESKAQTLISRRGFLYGAIGVGAVAVIAGGTGVVLSMQNNDEELDLETLSVPESAVTKNTDFEEVETAKHLSLVGEFTLPYGTLLWTSNDTLAACLIPNEDTSKPLTKVAILFFSSGSYPVMLEGAVGGPEGFDIYDVRANEQGLIWTEANIMQGIWRIYTCTMAGGILGEPVLVDEGDSEWETPTIACADEFAFWQVMPSLKGSSTTEDSLLKRAKIGQASSEVVYSSQGRMSSPLYALSDGVVITPRAKTTGVYHQLTLIKASDGSVQDRMVLPQSMKPLEAGYGTTGFTFSFDGIYNYGDGIANLGTYVPDVKHDAEAYQGLTWFRHAKNPSAPPAWCGPYFMVKSTMQVIGFDFSQGTSFIIDIDTGSDDYGDYLASTGVNNTVVTYANVDTKTTAGEEKRHTLVRVWRPLSQETIT